MVRDLNIPVKVVWACHGAGEGRAGDEFAQPIFDAGGARRSAGHPGGFAEGGGTKFGGGDPENRAEVDRENPGARLDYLELVDAETLEPVKNLRGKMRLATAVFSGKARLIDNIGVPRAHERNLILSSSAAASPGCPSR